MKNIMLVKQHSSVQLAHLYEHLYCMRLKQMFATHGLYKLLDFSLQGSTFTRSGLIEIDVELFTPEAIALIDEVGNQKIALDPPTITIGLTQLVAELETPLSYSNPDAVLRELKLLNEASWQDIDELELFDSRHVRRRFTPIRTGKEDSLPARIIHAQLVLHPEFVKNHSHLLPLYWLLTKIITHATEDTLVQFGYYWNDMSFESDVRTAYRKFSMRVAHGDDKDVDLKAFIKAWTTTIKQQYDSHAYTRLCRELQATNHRHAPWLAPASNTIMCETGVYMGAKGWKQTATADNIRLLLRHSTLEVRFGRQKYTQTLAELL